MAVDLIDSLLRAVGAAANCFGASLVPRPELTDETSLQSAASELTAALGGEELKDIDAGLKLPVTRQAWSFRGLPQILLISTPDPTPAGRPNLAPLFLWLGLVRSRLSLTQAADLTAFIVLQDSPELGASQWAAQVERDPRFCRKLIWLLSPGDDADASSARFLERTFLAQPWTILSRQDPRDLDPFAGIAAEVALTSSLSVDVVNSWLKELADGQLTGTDLSEELVRLLLPETDRPNDSGSNR